jgi:acetolactate synthase-1/2/3 large subunit
VKYSDVFASWLSEMGYTHCFYVAGGNIMHILESASSKFTCIPVVHEVTAGIAAEYFNEVQLNSDQKAFALVTAGPGLTNIITAIAGAFLESRDLLVVGGQVKSSDLGNGLVRQSGIQEIDGISLTKSLTVNQLQIKLPVARHEVEAVIKSGLRGRKGPVFIEFCIDAQGSSFDEGLKHVNCGDSLESTPLLNPLDGELIDVILRAKRPVLLIGGGVHRSTSLALERELAKLPIPVMTTWNGADRISSAAESFFGRPNTWGQRYSNVILQQADLLIALGTRLGMQQTGFNWTEFLPLGEIIQVDLDENELSKSNPTVKYPVHADANQVLTSLIEVVGKLESQPEWENWVEFCRLVKSNLPLSEESNYTKGPYVNPYEFYLSLSELVEPGDSIIPSSSGAAETVAMQALNQKSGVRIVTNKGLASMGYGLAGAIGASLAGANRVIHIEGDGGFAQNIQDLGTVSYQGLNVKSFIFCNDGYASIRMTQKSYFDGHYLGCDRMTGLGLPDWHHLGMAYSIPVTSLDSASSTTEQLREILSRVGPAIILVPVDPEQTYFPKITSRIEPGGHIVSNPIHLMTPPLDSEIAEIVFRFIPSS